MPVHSVCNSSKGHSTAASASTSPSSAQAYSAETAPLNTVFSMSADLGLLLHSATTPSKNAVQDRPAHRRLRISSPHLPRLNVHVPEVSARLSGHPTSGSSTRGCPTPISASFKARGRRDSWSPSQTIPEGYYSRGFTLTTFHKDKASFTPLFASSFATASTLTTAPSSALKRANTHRLQRKETLAPFRRLVGRSKSLKLKHPHSSSKSAQVMPSNVEYTQACNNNHNSYQDDSSQRVNKVVHLNGARSSTDGNSMDESSGHGNSIQSKERTGSPEHSHQILTSTASALPKATQSISGLDAAPVTSVTKPAIAALCTGPTKPLWQHTRTNAEEILALQLTSQEVQKQETIFELIYTESEYLDDLKSIHKACCRYLKRSDTKYRTLVTHIPVIHLSIQQIFFEELNIKMAEARRKKRSSPDKADVRLYERLARLLSHIKDLWNGHQSLLRFYMFSIYDSYFAQYATTSRDFQHVASGSSELCLIIKDLINLTIKTDPDYKLLERALSNHQRELTKIDDRIWIEEHNEMLMDLQQRIKGLPANFSLVERHRYLILDGPVHRIASRQPSRFSFRRHSHAHGKSDSKGGSQEWREGFRSPISRLQDENEETPTIISKPRQLDYYHQHAKPAFPLSPPSSSSSSSSTTSLKSPTSPFSGRKPVTPRAKSYVEPSTRDNLSPPTSSSALYSLSPYSASAPSVKSSPTTSKQPTVSQLVSQYNFNLSSSFLSFSGNGNRRGSAGHPRNISSSALYLPSVIKNSTDVEAEYHVFIFTDIVLWTKRVMSRYHRKEGVPWNFKLVEPVSRLTSVCNTTEDNIFMCTSVNTSSTSYLVRTEDEIAARMWKTTVPSLVPFHCSRTMRDQSSPQ
ncbi:hypothetical protein EC968_003348 [Mortierella alpina]|nr:hypothetical protein EC968_003348 [Mortierella alpina]